MTQVTENNGRRVIIPVEGYQIEGWAVISPHGILRVSVDTDPRITARQHTGSTAMPDTLQVDGLFYDRVTAKPSPWKIGSWVIKAVEIGR